MNIKGSKNFCEDNENNINIVLMSLNIKIKPGVITKKQFIEISNKIKFILNDETISYDQILKCLNDKGIQIDKDVDRL